ncbi:MAG: GatB/YqeY domain-containing protein [Proteobacteria bacterium]|nr:GatB/YqeY domain-containing protein [Pseudomonadota bacterium]MCH7834169.1 GatB/YqeY domain-containing protein [Pseudomonadota bacterium]
MSLKVRITDDMKSAMKAGEKDRLKVVRLIMAAIKQVEVDSRIELDDAGILTVLLKMVKQRRDSVSQFGQGGRQDLVDIELAEIEVLKAYLPEQLDDAELDTLIDEAIRTTGAASIRDMGKVMGIIKSKAAGRADMGAVGAKVKARLGAA